jgi:hypothetical protein
MSRPKGSLNKKTLLAAAPGNIPVKEDKPVKAVKTVSVFVPYAKSGVNKQGKIITYQTFKRGDKWLIDIFEGDKISIAGFDPGIVKLPDCIRFIDADLARL